ncbi:MAG: UvrD-helicase domain-containing protein [Leptospiraceae bacterium]|nr:UvrD-helicase domain-containing protein [Leptospiraceae bacterium]
MLNDRIFVKWIVKKLSSSKEYRFDEQKNNHVVIEASAGTGKTYTIEHMIPQFIEGGVSIEKVAVLTFTEKAAAELQDRIRKELIRSIEIPNLAQEKKDQLEEALELLPNANIGTIHHFCRSILKKHSLVLGLSAKFGEIRNVSEEIETYFKKFWWKIEKDDSEELIALLRKVDFPKFKSILVELTAKTGGNKIKLLDKSDGERLKKDLSYLMTLLDNANLPTKKTAYSNKLQAFQAKTFTSDNEIFLELKLACLTKDIKSKKLRLTDDVREFLIKACSVSERELVTLIERIIEALEKNSSVELFNPIFTYANELIEDFEKFLFSQDTVTVDGLILLTRKLLINFPEVKKQIQNSVDYLILDECQDTNPIQIDLVTELFSGLSKGIILVGDPKQSIYRFRDADLRSYAAAVNRLVGKQDLRLDISFRSSTRLVEVLNRIFPQFENLSKIYSPVNPSRTNEPKTKPPLILLGLDENNQPLTQTDTGDDFGADSLRDASIKEIIKTIHTITDNDEYLILEKETKEYRRIKYSDIAILAYTKDNLNLLLREFSKNAISANIYKSTLFYSHKIVQAISHLLHAVENPNDSASLYKTLASDLFLISESVLYELSEAGELSYLFDSKFSEINAIYESLRKAHENRYTKDIAYTLHEILRENQILEVLSIGFDGKRNLANIYHLSEMLSYTQLTENLSFGEIVRNLKRNVENSVDQEMKLDSDKKDDSFNSVQLMTMHVSKGLEFPVCILFNLAGGKSQNKKTLYIGDSLLRQSPLSVDMKLTLGELGDVKTPEFEELKSKDDEELLQEKDRLLYVAFTRARDYLVLPLHSMPKKNSSGSLRALIEKAFSPDNIKKYINENLAENFINAKRPKAKKEISTVKEKKPTSIQFEPIQMTHISPAEMYSKAGIKVQSYSSIARHLEPEEEFVKEKTSSEKKVAPENADNAPFTISSDKRGTTFGLLCHAVMENFDLQILSDEKMIESEVKRMVNAYYPTTGLNEIVDYTSKDAIEFCYSTLTKSYPMNAAKTEFAKIQDWKYLTREKSFFYKLQSSKIDFLVGIGDGMFYWNDKYYLLDWKTNLIKPNEEETIDAILEKKVKDSYFYQYMIYSMNLIDNITPKKENKKEYWEKKFGGMLFVFMRVKEDKQGSLLVKPTYEEILAFKKDLEK